jgi:hypothetical protein
MESKILEGGLLEIETIKNQLLELEKCLKEKKELEESEKKVKKNLEKMEKERSDEVEKVIKKRREQLEDSFDENIDHTESKLKDAESNKKKRKEKAIHKRIEFETADLRSDEQGLVLEKEAVFKEEGISSLYKTQLFFSLYFPQRLGDYLIIVLFIAFAFFVIPFGLYTLIFEGMGTLYLALCYLGVIIIFGGLYLLVSKRKYKDLEALKKIKEINNKIRENRKKQKTIKGKIVKDKDESKYNLDEFDERIQNSNQEISKYLDRKKNALLEFDRVTSEDIKKQIQAENQEELNKLKGDYNKYKDQRDVIVRNCNSLSLVISTNYESVLGKSFMTPEKLDLMASTIESGQAKNIGQAKIFISKKDEASEV